MSTESGQQMPDGLPKTTASKIREIGVGIGEIKVSGNPAAALVAYGIGSCVSVCVYDPLVQVAGMAHVLLPSAQNDKYEKNRTIYADVAIPELLRKMKEKGAVKRRLKVRLAGGARVVKSLSHPDGDIGKRNIAEVKRLLGEHNADIDFMDVGGAHGRTIRFYVETGEVVVSSARRPTKKSG
jgi:chemotaxis protein CheD